MRAKSRRIVLRPGKSFETVLEFKEWPYVKPAPVFVLSNSLEELPAGLPVKVEIVKGGLKE